MKHIIFAIACIFFFFLMLFLPNETLSGATNGLLLWFHIILPTLLPFFIITNLLIQTNSIYFVSRFCGKFVQRFFGTSSLGSFAVLSGMLCGYPIGAKVTADLVKENHITIDEGKYLLSFCNNTSPAFITSFVVLQNLKDESMLFPTLIILYTSPILCSFIFRKIHHTSHSYNATQNMSNKEISFCFETFDNCIMDAFENITKIGGYIILFSILFFYGEALSLHYTLPLLEITNGISFLTKTIPSFDYLYIYCLGLTSFGGLCSIVQTKAMLNKTKLSIFPYIIEKLITAMATSLLAYLYVFFIRQ